MIIDKAVLDSLLSRARTPKQVLRSLSWQKSLSAGAPGI
jgi:hypothetical protein